MSDSSHPPGRLSPARRRLLDRVLDGLLDADDGDRREYLAGLRRRCPRLTPWLERLVEASTAPTDFLEGPLGRLGGRALSEYRDQEERLPSGTRLGPWRLLELVGSGGMGQVYRGERADGAFEMTVAVKLIRKLEQPLARRLEAERRVMARLEHPVIARLIDGGMTGDGRAWLVMEWVPGEDLGDWLQRSGANLTERLAVFRQVARAVAHAHRRLIVHGDIKPANIRVTPEGRARLLDFGVARVLAGEHGADDDFAALTPAFAAPEQERGEPVSPQSDVWSLGALLYWLLSGRVPRRDAAAARLARLSREYPRGRELASLVERAVADDPDDRYDGVPELIADLQRFHDGFPLAAMPSERGYRAVRFLARNRGKVAAAALGGILLAGGVAGIAWQSRVALVERDRAQLEARKTARVSEYLVSLFEQADPRHSLGREISARELVAIGSEQVQELSEAPLVQAEMLRVLGEVNRSLGDFDTAEELIRRAREILAASGESGELARVLHSLGMVLNAQGRYPESERIIRDALDLLAPEQREERAQLLNSLGNAQFLRGDYEQAEASFRNALELYQQLEPDGRGVADTRANLGRLFSIQDQHRRAQDEFLQAFEIRSRILGESHPATVAALFDLADVAMRLGRLESAETRYREVLERRRTLYGENHPGVAQILHSLGTIRWRQDDVDGAEPYWRKALEIRRETLDPLHPQIGASLNALSVVERHRGNLDATRELLEEVLEIARTRYGDPHYTVAVTLHNMATLAVEQGDLDAGEDLHGQALAMRRELMGDIHSEVAISQQGMARLHRARGDYETALEWAEDALDTFVAVHGDPGHPEAQSTVQLIEKLRAELEEQG